MSGVDIRIFGRETPENAAVAKTSEEVCSEMCEKRLQFRPVVVPLFALKSGKTRLWLANHRTLDESGDDPQLELRLRFKVPYPDKLMDLDKAVFEYFYRQVETDFKRSQVTKDSAQELHAQKTSSKSKAAVWLPVVTTNSDEVNIEANKVNFYKVIVRLASLIMTAAVLENDLKEKDLIKYAHKFIPEDVFPSSIDRIFGDRRLRQLTANSVQHFLKLKYSAAKLKRTFLREVEEVFPAYFEEHYAASLKDEGKVKLVFKPPFVSWSEPFESIEPVLMAETESKKNGVKCVERKTLCALEDIVSISESDADLCLELARKNGIPLYLTLQSRAEVSSFLSLLSGYYRLCEKWTFSLSDSMVYQSLKNLRANNVHGPLLADFVEDKFRSRSRQNKVGTFLLRQCTEKYNLIYLHYVSSVDNKVSVIQIWKGNNDSSFRINLPLCTRKFSSLTELVKFLRDPEASPIPLSDCLHPSEYDMAPTLLLCRSIDKLRADILKGRGGYGPDASSKKENRAVIPLNQLCRFEAQKFEGKFTNVWKGKWEQGREKGKEVAIKQLKTKYQKEKLFEFNDIAYNVMMWNDGTLMDVFGVCLATRLTPMACIAEYFPAGPLDEYLRKYQSSVKEIDLVEACGALSRALWYLEQNGDNFFPHGNIRCSNVFVSEHSDRVFKVKLGDPSLSEIYAPEEVHWLPLEMLLREQPGRAHCTFKSDVWALATTFWQIFSYGSIPLPGVDPAIAKEKYIQGDRLKKPAYLNEDFLGKSIANLMHECWNPSPDLRKEPQAILKEMNQLLYRVFNTRKVHIYYGIDNEDNVYAASQNGSSSGSSTINGSNGSSTQTVITRLDSSQPSVPPTLISMDSRVSNASNGSLSTQALVPSYNHIMKTFMEHAAGTDFVSSDAFSNLFRGVNGIGAATGGRMTVAGGTFNRSDSSDWLISGTSRPGSSMEEGSLFRADGSQLTSQTSLASYSSLYSMSSIYQITNDSQLELNTDFPLGEGNFGVVYKGVLTRSNDWEEVAVKMLRDNDPSGDVFAADEMRRELEIMRSLSHDNVVKIKAVRRDESKVFIVMEYVKEGSLEKYVSANRLHLEVPKQLFVFARNIVDGMEYLVSKGIIHRDLAARNILVANEECVKISDFGLARTVEQGQQSPYVSSSANVVPVMWLAFECLKHRQYSFASDVWSFGITLWEMFSFGEKPFLPGCENFFKTNDAEEQNKEWVFWQKSLEDGKRLPKPENCPIALYADVMLGCWNIDPKRRPSFTELGALIQKIFLQVT